jgi:hypothetical protein
MHAVNSELRRGELRAAAALPQLIEGAALGPPEYRLKQRPNGVWAIFEGAKYVKTTGLRDRLMAGEFLEIFRLQQEARSEGIIDARYVQADVIAGYYLEQIPAGRGRRPPQRHPPAEAVAARVRWQAAVRPHRGCGRGDREARAGALQAEHGPGFVPGAAHRDPGLLPGSRHTANHAVRGADAAAGLRPRAHGGAAEPGSALGPRQRELRPRRPGPGRRGGLAASSGTAG